VDTGGIGLRKREKSQDKITEAAVQQVTLAMDAADVILLVVNVQEGIVPLDREVAQRLRSYGRPVLVVVNKVDNRRAEAGLADFAQLGFDQMFPVSAIHGEGMDALMQAAVTLLPKEESSVQPGAEQEPDVDSKALRLTIVGRPNVGKSSIINALTRSERVIVSDIPGTTRDSVDVPFEVETDGVRQPYVLIDTAGMRKARRVKDSIEFFSVKRAEDSIERADIVVLVMDAEMGVTEQDKKIGDRIVKAGKACVLVVNKWDLVSDAVQAAQKKEMRRRSDPATRYTPKTLTALSEFGKWVQTNLFFLDYAPVIFTSAKTGFHLDRLLEAIRYVAAQLQQQIPTSLLNRTLRDAVERRQPVSERGHRLKFFYATQVKQAPPTFLLFVNRDELFSEPYKKHLAGDMRRAFGYEGCPIILVPKPRPKTIESKRKRKPPQKRSTGTRHRRTHRTKPRGA
jgi:GTP-binding protein